MVYCGRDVSHLAGVGVPAQSRLSLGSSRLKIVSGMLTFFCCVLNLLIFCLCNIVQACVPALLCRQILLDFQIGR